MQLNSEVLNTVSFLVGSSELAAALPATPAKEPFADEIVELLCGVSKALLGNAEAKTFSDVVTFAFWIRKASILKLKERFQKNTIRLGRGTAFHIAPSNVPVNFAYSLAAGLLCGNANVVRVPSRDFPQVRIIADAFKQALALHPSMKPYVLLVRYGREKSVNDWFSSVADVRIIWGGDQTIRELRQSPLPPRSGEIAFADRYSLAVIDADAYLATENKRRIAQDFFNDTFFTDQNACTSPQAIIWAGTEIERAKAEFWREEYEFVKDQYTLQEIQSVDKLAQAYLYSALEPGVRIEGAPDNLIVRVAVPRLTENLMDYKGNSGFFFEYDCRDITELRVLCDDKRCQTIAYIGDGQMLLPLLRAGVKGIDRIVPIGKTMDFDLIWDGYELPAFLTRTVAVG